MSIEFKKVVDIDFGNNSQLYIEHIPNNVECGEMFRGLLIINGVGKYFKFGTDHLGGLEGAEEIVKFLEGIQETNDKYLQPTLAKNKLEQGWVAISDKGL